MLLADLGGRRLKLARAAETGISPVHSRVWPDEPGEAEFAWLEEQRQNEALLLSSTRPAALRALADHLGASLREVRPEEVPLERSTTGTGSDRLLAALAAHRRAGGAALVADLGTAWTLDCVDARPCFRGGAIGAGLGVQEGALAAACPHLDPPAADDPAVIPASTAAAVRAGTALALAAAIDALAQRWEQELDAPTARYLTGGDADRLQPLMDPRWQRGEDLVLLGLAELARR
ncbi:MAG: hypothetical protein CMJ94_09875 [Planctomycetes bacterium]|nr:hypothetical protein [Planctomycetota bacterium]